MTTAVHIPCEWAYDVATRHYALNAPATFALGEGRAARWLRRHGRYFESMDGSLAIDATAATLDALPFPASSRLWDGPDLIPDTSAARLWASLWHDLAWGHDAEIAAAWGLSPLRVRLWGNLVMHRAWTGAARSVWSRVGAGLAFIACSLAAPVWPLLRRMKERISQ